MNSRAPWGEREGSLAYLYTGYKRVREQGGDVPTQVWKTRGRASERGWHWIERSTYLPLCSDWLLPVSSASPAIHEGSCRVPQLRVEPIRRGVSDEGLNEPAGFRGSDRNGVIRNHSRPAPA
jgi:hypothetical protein